MLRCSIFWLACICFARGKPAMEIELEDVMMQDSPGVNKYISVVKLQENILGMESFIRKQEKRMISGFDGMKKRIAALQKLASKTRSDMKDIEDGLRASCPILTAIQNGRLLGGKKRNAGDEAYHVCNIGYELVGEETTVCLENRTWSGVVPSCREIDLCQSSPCLNGGTCLTVLPSSFKCLCSEGYSGQICQRADNQEKVMVLQPPAMLEDENSESEFEVRSSFSKSETKEMTPICRKIGPHHTQCACPPGYRLSLDQNHCEDIDECSLFDVGSMPLHSLDACQYNCQNTPGSYVCTCPSGHKLNEAHTCSDIDECRQGTHNCNSSSECFNTIGGFKCVSVVCPPSYVNTAPKLCERMPCAIGNKSCLSNPLTITFNFMTLPLDAIVPTRIFRLTAQSGYHGSNIRFSVARSTDSSHFSVRRHDRRTGYLILNRLFPAPKTVTVDFQINEYEYAGKIASSHVARIVIFFTQPQVY